MKFRLEYLEKPVDFGLTSLTFRSGRRIQMKPRSCRYVVVSGGKREYFENRESAVEYINGMAY